MVQAGAEGFPIGLSHRVAEMTQAGSAGRLASATDMIDKPGPVRRRGPPVWPIPALPMKHEPIALLACDRPLACKPVSNNDGAAQLLVTGWFSDSDCSGVAAFA